MIPLPRISTPRFTIRPTDESDREALFRVAKDPLLWDQHNASDRYHRPVFDKLFQDGLDSRGSLTFVQKSDGRVIGSSRYKMLPADEIEIGWTYLDRSLWGTGANRELKHALMKHAYQFTDKIYWFVYEKNFRSRRAVEKLGAQATTPDHPLNQPERVVYALTKDAFLAEGPPAKSNL